MNGIRVPLLLAIALASCLPSCLAVSVTFDFAHVGNAGNAADVRRGFDGNPRNTFGAVAYNFAIAKTEVTNAQYAAFLNAVDPTADNTLGLYNPEMAGNFGGIEATGGADGTRYAAQAGREQNPVTYVSFFDAMRFTNWLHNGQGNSGTETGAYTIGNGRDEVRSTNAKFWIPSEDEWFKAAYHDASAGTNKVYFTYANGSNTIPVSDQPHDNPAAANYRNDDGLANGFNDGFAVNGSPSYPGSTNPLTDVGAYTTATSPYGTFDQNGSVWEWNEAELESDSCCRGLRGGSWDDDDIFLRVDNRILQPAMVEGSSIGFRIASIPEPTTLALALLAATVGVRRR